MDRILSKISGPLLLGSILALGAMAWPGQASAASQFFFRGNAGLLPMQVAAVPEEDGKTGNDTAVPEQRQLTMSYDYGYTLTCSTNWTSAFVAEHQTALTQRYDARIPDRLSPATLSLQRPHNGAGVGSVTATNVWFDLGKASDPVSDFPVTFPMVVTWVPKTFEPDPRLWETSGFPCTGDVTVSGPELTSSPGAILIVKLTGVAVE